MLDYYGNFYQVDTSQREKVQANDLIFALDLSIKNSCRKPLLNFKILLTLYFSGISYDIVLKIIKR
jgi:hypothetical protein